MTLIPVRFVTILLTERNIRKWQKAVLNVMTVILKNIYSILTNKDNPQTKTEQEKQYTKSFKKYDFTAIITDIAHKHKIIETFPDYNLDDKKVSEMILYLFYPHAQLAKTTLQRTNIFMIDDYADDLSKKLINRYNENEQALEFFEYEPLNEALTFETNDVLKRKFIQD